MVGFLKDQAVFKEITIAGPGFINLKFTDEALSSRLNDLEKDDRSGGWTNTEPAKVVIDYGGPNVAKPLHVGHLRAAIIGESLKRIFRFSGDTVTGDVHLAIGACKWASSFPNWKCARPIFLTLLLTRKGRFLTNRRSAYKTSKKCIRPRALRVKAIQRGQTLLEKRLKRCKLGAPVTEPYGVTSSTFQCHRHA